MQGKAPKISGGRARSGRRARSGLGLRPTREGLRLILLLVIMGFAAYNTRNNLLYLMFSVGSAAVLLSLVVGRLSLRGLRLEAEAAQDLYAGTPSTEVITVDNRSPFFELYGVDLEELDFPGQPPRARLRWVGRRSRVVATLEKVYPRRGWFESRRFRATTGYPFGLFEAVRVLVAPRRLIVYPSIHRVDISFAFEGRSGPVPRRQRPGESEELLRMRQYVAGDNIHHLHWKATAKLGELIVREFSSEQRRRFCIVFDRELEHRSPESLRDFETMVSGAASLATHLADHGLSFGFVADDASFPHDTSGQHLRGVLSYLALVEPSRVSSEQLIVEAAEAAEKEDIVFVFRLRQDKRLTIPSSPQIHTVDPAALLVPADSGRV